MCFINTNNLLQGFIIDLDSHLCNSDMVAGCVLDLRVR